MKAKEIYKRYLLKINKNDSNDGVNILPSAFVLMFNTERYRWLGEKLTAKGDSIKLDRLDMLYLSDVEVFKAVNGDGAGWIEFDLPDNFYRHSSSYALVNKGSCTNIPFFYFEKKTLGFSANLADDSTKAHFDYEEGPIQFTQGKVKAYTDDFTISHFYTSYYRVPNTIDIVGYTHIDGTPSKDVDSELPDDNIDEILNRMAIEAAREFSDSDGVALGKDRTQTEP